MISRFYLLVFCFCIIVTVARSQGISWVTTSTNDTSIWTYNFNSGASSLAASYNFPSLSLKASAVNKQAGLTYLLMKDLKASQHVLLSLDLTSRANGTLTLQNLPMASLEYCDMFVDNSGDIMVIVQDSNPALSGSVLVFSVNAQSGALTQLSVLAFKSNSYFVSSSFFTNSNTYVGLFTSLENARGYFLAYSVDSNAWNTYDAPTGLAALAADPLTGQLAGVLTNAPPGWTQVVTYNYATRNTTYVGSPLTAQNYAYCGSARGVVTQGLYFVNCCADALCSQGSVVYSNNLRSNSMNFVTKIGAPVTFGLFAL